jgi:hypothetical protein
VLEGAVARAEIIEREDKSVRPEDIQVAQCVSVPDQRGTLDDLHDHAGGMLSGLFRESDELVHVLAIDDPVPWDIHGDSDLTVSGTIQGRKADQARGHDLPCKGHAKAFFPAGPAESTVGACVLAMGVSS